DLLLRVQLPEAGAHAGAGGDEAPACSREAEGAAHRDGDPAPPRPDPRGVVAVLRTVTPRGSSARGEGRGRVLLEDEPAGGRACLESSAHLERGVGVGTLVFRRVARLESIPGVDPAP